MTRPESRGGGHQGKPAVEATSFGTVRPGSRRQDAVAAMLASVRTPVRPHAMNFLLTLPAVLSLLMLGAHFYRAGQWPLALLSVLLLGVLAVPRAWAARTAQIALVLGAAEWVWTTVGFVQQRMAQGAPWTRLALILGAVAAVALLAAALFQTRRLRARYGLR